MLCPFLRGFEAIQPKYLPTKAQLNQAEKFRKKLIQRYGSMYNIKILEKTESRPILYLQVVHRSGELWLLCQRSEANKRKNPYTIKRKTNIFCEGRVVTKGSNPSCFSYIAYTLIGYVLYELNTVPCPKFEKTCSHLAK